MSQNITVDVAPAYQGLVYFPGDGLALHLADSDTHLEEILLGLSPVQRLILSTRLRAFADMADAAE